MAKQQGHSRRSPIALIYDPIVSMVWDYQVEVDELLRAGVELIVPRSNAERAPYLEIADVIVVSASLANDDLRRARNCCGILCYSVGVDGVDLELARRQRITVLNIPDYCTEEVSDHAMALLLALQRRVVEFATEAAKGNWDVYRRPSFSSIRRLAGQVVGVVGLGRIGARVAAKAQGLGMRVVGHDPCMRDSTEVHLASLDELLAMSDAIVLCAPLTADTFHMISSHELGLMKPEAFLINVARGGLIDEIALAHALRTRQIAGAALDVRAEEPPDPASDPLLALPTVLLTPHVGSTSVDAWADIHRMASERILALLVAEGRIAAPIGHRGFS
jgi:D-3-phosphoglycerate dehydrogenase